MISFKIWGKREGGAVVLTMRRKNQECKENKKKKHVRRGRRGQGGEPLPSFGPSLNYSTSVCTHVTARRRVVCVCVCGTID